MSIRFVPEKAKSSFTPTQYALVEDGFYAGFFARYSVPKMVKKFNAEGEELKIYLAFLVTHGINERALPRITQASAFVPFKRVYVEKTGMESKYLAFEHALLSKKFTKASLAEAEDEAVPTLDEMIGKPAIVQIARAAKPNKDGVVELRIRDFQPPTTSMEATLRDWYKSMAADGKIQFGTTEKDGLRYMSEPKAATEPILGSTPTEITERYEPDEAFDQLSPDDFPADELPF